MLIPAVKAGMDVVDVVVIDEELIELVEVTDVDDDVLDVGGMVVVPAAGTVVVMEAGAVLVVGAAVVVVGVVDATVVVEIEEVERGVGSGPVPPQRETSAAAITLSATRFN
jgi:hypothetical protein